jgi:hypothetical protein
LSTETNSRGLLSFTSSVVNKSDWFIPIPLSRR